MRIDGADERAIGRIPYFYFAIEGAESLKPESERNDRESAGNKSVTYPAPVVLDFHKAVKANN